MEDLRKFFKDLAVQVDRFGLPVITILVGIGLTIYAQNNDQSDLFLYGGLAIAFAGLVFLFYALGMIKNRFVQIGLTLALLIIATGMAYFNYSTISHELAIKKKKKRIKNTTVQGLKDIRKVEIAYMERYGGYTGSFDTLIQFLSEDSLAFVRAEGSRPDTLTEKEALELGIIKRDTFYTPALDSLFSGGKKARKERIYPFILDSLPYKRGSGKKFILRSGVVEKSGGIRKPVFMAKDPDPFMTKDTLQVGSLTDTKTSGNWTGGTN